MCENLIFVISIDDPWSIAYICFSLLTISFLLPIERVNKVKHLFPIFGSKITCVKRLHCLRVTNCKRHRFAMLT